MRVNLLFIFLCISGFCFSQSDVYMYKDSSSSLTKETIVNKEFIIVKKQVLEKYSDDTYWFKIPAHKTDSEYIFRITYERYNDADVYQNSKKIEKLKNQRFLSFQFSRNYDVYVKINPNLHSYIPFELDTVEKSTFKNNNQLLLNGFYYGFAFLVVIYNLFYYFLFKDNAFLYYALFLASMTFGIYTMDGMLNYLNITGNFNNFLMVLNYCFLSFFSLKFINKYLFLDEYYPKLKRASYVIGYVMILLSIIFLISQDFYILLLLGVLMFSLLLTYWFFSIYLFHKNVYNKILVFAYVIILFSGIDYFILKFLGISFINTDAITIKIGAFLEMIILSIAVLYRMKTLKEENDFMTEEIVKYSELLNGEDSKKDTNTFKENIKNLSVREREIFDLILLGKSNKEIAETVNVSVNTVKFHVKNIYEKLHIKSRKEAFNLSVN